MQGQCRAPGKCAFGVRDVVTTRYLWLGPLQGTLRGYAGMGGSHAQRGGKSGVELFSIGQAGCRFVGEDGWMGGWVSE